MQRVKPQLTQEEYEEKLANIPQTYVGEEIVDGTPVEPPLGYKRQPTMVEHLREMVRSELLRREVEAMGAESFEEADDFDVDDEVDISSGYEFEDVFEPPPARSIADEMRDALASFFPPSSGEREGAPSSGAATSGPATAAGEGQGREAPPTAGAGSGDP